MDRIKYFFKIAFRNLITFKWFTIINIVGLAFGFTCAILILAHVLKEYSYNKHIPDSERVFCLVQKSSKSSLGNTTISYALSPLLANKFPEIEYYARTENYSNFSNCIISYRDPDSEKLVNINEKSFCLADNDLFEIIKYPFVEGSRDNALKSPNSIVLSEKTAKKYFGNEPVLGKSLTLNNKHIYTVTGIVQIPVYSTFHFSMLAPIASLRSKSELQGWDSNGQPFFKLNKNIAYKEFNKRIEHFIGELKPANIRNPESLTLSFFPITDRHLYYNKNSLYLLIFMGFVVLSVSVMNYINMSTSLVMKRRSEIALKKISGAGKKIIGLDFIKETSIVSFIALVIGMLLTVVALPLFKKLTGSDIQPYLESHFIQIIIYSLGLWLIISLIAGFYPAIVLSGVHPLALFSKGKSSSTGIRSKNILITAQFGISIILVIITIMVNRQYRYMEQIPLGFDNEMVMQIPFTNNLKKDYQNLKNEISTISTVKHLCAASSMPVGISNHSGVSWVNDQGEKQEESFSFAIVSDGYTQTFDMQMVLGNEFESSRAEELKGVLVNEEAAKILGYKNPIGKQIHFWGKQNTIIGVVKDFQNNYLFNKVKPMVMSAHPSNQGFTKYLFVSIRPENITRTIKELEKAIKEISPEFPFEYSFTNAEVEGYISEIKQLNATFRFASVVSILLATIGLIALTYQAMQSRIKEIGIRKVNGAKSAEIIKLLNSSFLRNVAIAYFIACPVAWIIIFNLLKEIGNKASIAWWIFILAGIVVGTIALLTVSFQSWRAATRNPVESLRYE